MKVLIFLCLALNLSLLQGQSALLENTHAAQSALAYDPALKPFYHGVASGDPLSDRVIIWTRVTPDTNFAGNSLSGSWYVATDTGMSNIVQQGFFATDSSRDYTVKIDVTGLQAGTTYYYMFSSGGRNSLRGRTKTLPVGAVNRLKFAVVSCNNYEAGFFNGFGRIADRNDLDAVIHLGDYIYEYEAGNYGDSITGRFHQNFETISKSQYRSRYSLYRLDPDLRRAHQQHPFICVWDDHESANDAWMGGAENHDPATEGSWMNRRDDAAEVYFEWIPIRDNATNKIYREFNYGDLVDLVMLDTRLEGREQQINDVTDPALYSSSRTLLGAAQYGWFTNALDQSNARWRVIGNQVIFAPLQLGWAGPSTGQTPQQVESLFLDIWDGYPAERLKIIQHLENNNIDNTVFVTGDFHSTFAFDIADTVVDESNNYAPVNNYDPANGAGSKAVEFATPSITSANFDENVDALTAAALEIQINAPLPAPFPPNNPNPHLKFVDLDRHGYFVLDLSPDSAKANYYYLPILTADPSENFGGAWKTIDGDNHLTVAVESGPKAQLDDPAPSTILSGPINLEEETTFTLFNLYPNPARKSLNVQLGNLQEGEIILEITDLQGRMVRSETFSHLRPGIFEIQLSLTGLPAQTYLLNIRQGGMSRQYRFIVK